MAKKITFKIPTVKGPLDANGLVAWLNVGVKRHKFVLQYETELSDTPYLLTDYASGYKLCDLGPQALARYVSNPYAWEGVKTIRRLAQDWIDCKADEMSPKTLLEMLGSVPRLND